MPHDLKPTFHLVPNWCAQPFLDGQMCGSSLIQVRVQTLNIAAAAPNSVTPKASPPPKPNAQLFNIAFDLKYGFRGPAGLAVVNGSHGLQA